MPYRPVRTSLVSTVRMCMIPGIKDTTQLYFQVSIQLHWECFVVPSTLITHSRQLWKGFKVCSLLKLLPRPVSRVVFRLSLIFVLMLIPVRLNNTPLKPSWLTDCACIPPSLSRFYLLCRTRQRLSNKFLLLLLLFCTPRFTWTPHSTTHTPFQSAWPQ